MTLVNRIAGFLKPYTIGLCLNSLRAVVRLQGPADAGRLFAIALKAEFPEETKLELDGKEVGRLI